MDFYQNDKKNILTSIEDLILFANYAQDYLYKLKGENDLIILEPERPDLVLAVLLGNQNNTDQFLISNTLKNSPEFLAQFENVQSINTLQLENLFYNFKQTNQNQLAEPISTEILQNIAMDNNNFIWFKTSGSSGSPKYIQHNFQNFIKSTQLSYRSYLHKFSDINWSLNLSIDHIGGFMALFRSYFLGGQVTHFYWKEPGHQDNPNTFSLVPTQVQWILENPLSQLHKLFIQAQLIVISGGEISTKMISAIKSIKKSGNVVFSYGATETCSQIAVGFFDKRNKTLKYRPFQNVKINSNDEKTTIFSPTICNAIFQNHHYQNLKRQDSVGQVDLSDRTEITEDGYFLVLGRTDEIIISGGENISTQKIQNALKKLNPDESFIVQGILDKKWGQKVICFTSEVRDYNPQLLSLNLLEKHELPKIYYDINKVPHAGVKIGQSDYINFHRINKDPWVAFHGLMGSPHDWQQLNQAGISNLHPIDLNQFLDAENWKETSELLLDQIEKILEQHEKINLIGYSMGARILLSLVRPLRDKINQVVIISSHFGDILDHRQKQERLLKDQELLTGITNEQQWKDFLEKWYSQDLFKEIKQSPNYAQMLLSKDFSNIKEYQKQLNLWSPATMPNYKMTYPKEIWSRTTLISGELDQKYSEYLEKLAQEKKTIYHKIKGHSHALLISAAKEISNCLYKFDD